MHMTMKAKFIVVNVFNYTVEHTGERGSQKRTAETTGLNRHVVSDVMREYSENIDASGNGLLSDECTRAPHHPRMEYLAEMLDDFVVAAIRRFIHSRFFAHNRPFSLRELRYELIHNSSIDFSYYDKLAELNGTQEGPRRLRHFSLSTLYRLLHHDMIFRCKIASVTPYICCKLSY